MAVLPESVSTSSPSTLMMRLPDQESYDEPPWLRVLYPVLCVRPAHLSTIRAQLILHGFVQNSTSPESIAAMLVEEGRRPGTKLQVLPRFLFTMTPSATSNYKHTANYRYKRRYRSLQKLVRHFVFENASLCDEVVHLEERLLKTRAERSFLLKKLLQFQSISELANLVTQAQAASSTSNVDGVAARKVDAKKKFSANDAGDTRLKKVKKVTRKKSKPQSDIPSKPVLPIELGELTVHQLGEVTDKVDVCPVGFRSTRLFTDVQQPQLVCSYTCSVVDDGSNRRFEITHEKEPDKPFTGSSADETYLKLLKAIEPATEITDANGLGSLFFGFTHPTIQAYLKAAVAESSKSFKRESLQTKMSSVEAADVDVDPDN